MEGIPLGKEDGTADLDGWFDIDGTDEGWREGTPLADGLFDMDGTNEGRREGIPLGEEDALGAWLTLGTKD